MSYSRKDWLDVTEVNQSDITWIFKKYECPKYMFAGEYNNAQVKEKILKTHRIKDAISQHIEENQITHTKAYKEAGDIIDEIAHTFSLTTIRGMALLFMKICRSLFQNVLVNRDGIQMYSECSKLTPVVLVPTHNSYFDFLLASLICFHLNLPLPAIVAGQDFLGMAVINHLLRQSGAFYMRRSFASDSFYRNIFTEYVQQILALGERPIEFFPEGTRSRCGKALQPKVGLLSMVLESFFHGFVQDVTFIPISISYEKITEEQLYLFELLGIPKPKESLSGLVKARSVLQSDFGRVVFNFGDAMSIREYCYWKINSDDYIHIPRCERHLNIFGRDAQEMKIAKYFGEKIVFKQQCKMVIFPRAVLSTIMLQNPGKTKNIDEICYEVDQIGRWLEQLGCTLVGFQEMLTDNKQSIKKAIGYTDLVLQNTSNDIIYNCETLIDEKMSKSQLAQAFTHESLDMRECLAYIYLSFQRNRLMNLCFYPSFLLHCMLVDNTKCEQNFMLLCDVFKTEFIFDPDVTLKQSYEKTISKLFQIKLICKTDENLLDVKNKLMADFTKSLLQPFIDGYTLIILCLLDGKFDYPISIKQLAASLQIMLVNYTKKVGLNTYEGLCLHTLSNAITSFCKNGALKTMKNAKFETLVNGVNNEAMTTYRNQLGKFSSPNVQLHLNKSQL